MRHHYLLLTLHRVYFAKQRRAGESLPLERGGGFEGS
jgi:hypothetical protein